MKGQSPGGLKPVTITFICRIFSSKSHWKKLSSISASRKNRSLISTKWVKLTPKISHILVLAPRLSWTIESWLRQKSCDMLGLTYIVLITNISIIKYLFFEYLIEYLCSVIFNLGACAAPRLKHYIQLIFLQFLDLIRFLQFLDRDELLWIWVTHPQTRLYSPLTRYVQNEIEAKFSIGFSAKGSIVSLVKSWSQITGKTKMAMQLNTSSSLDRSSIDYTSRNMQVAAVNSKRRYSSDCNVTGH